MIPNIFVSSTIEDHQHLRAVIKDTIEDLGYRHVMSEYGEVGYLPRISVEDSCYHSVGDCHLAVFIVGRRYGSLGANGQSMTHNEFMTTRDKGVPTVTLVDKEVMTFKNVYDSQPADNKPQVFQGMDSPDRVFQFIDTILQSPVNNGVLLYSSVDEARRLLKLQLAHIFGDLLQNRYDPVKTGLKDVLSEIKTLRHELQGTRQPDPQFLKAVRFMVDDANADYRHFIEHTYGPLDAAIPLLVQSPTFADYVKNAQTSITISKTKGQIKEMNESLPADEHMIFGSTRPWGAALLDPQATEREFLTYACFRGNKAVVNENALQEFEWKQHKLQQAIK